jgi:hypothetical protein
MPRVRLGIFAALAVIFFLPLSAYSQEIIKDGLNPTAPASVPLREAVGLDAAALDAESTLAETEAEEDVIAADSSEDVEDGEDGEPDDSEDESDESESDASDEETEEAEEDETEKRRSKPKKKKPSVFGSGTSYGNLLTIEKLKDDRGFLFVFASDPRIPRRSYYFDKRTKFYKVEERERSKITLDELVEGERVAISYIFQDHTYLADEVFLVIGEFHPQDYLPRSKRKRRRKSKS